MNALGKTLVVLNLLFALLTGGFIVFSYATRFRYDQALEKARDEMLAAKAASEGSRSAMAKLDLKYKNALAELDRKNLEMADKGEEWDAKEKGFKNDIERLKLELDAVKTNLRNKIEELVRRNVEVDTLLATLKKRDALIFDQEAEIAKLRTVASSLKASAESLQARNDQLLDRLRKAELMLVERSTGGSTPGLKSATDPNPPTVLIKGTVERIDAKNPDVVVLTVGTDRGLEKFHTLEVYRLEPPTYLGMIRIVEVDAFSAIGRLERSSAGARVTLKVGDKVISDLNQR